MNELRVGLLALVSIISIIIMSVKITSNQSGFGTYTEFHTVVDDAAGIFPKTSIKVAGINAGRIKNISLKGSQAKITFEVINTINVTEESYLKIKSVGFLGDKYIEIVLGDKTSLLPEGSFMPSKTGGGLEDLSKDASEVLNDLKSIMSSVKESVAPEGRETPLKGIIDNIIIITEDVRSLSSTMKRIVNNNEGRLNSLITSLQNAGQSIEYHLNAGNKKSLMKDLKKIGPILDNVDSLSGDLKEIVADLKEGKGTIGKLLRDEQVIDQVSKTLSGVQKIVNKVDSIRTELEMYTSFNTQEDNITEVNLSIFPSPERFYLLGISTSELGPENKKLITTSVDGGTESIESRNEVKKDTFRFNAQIGRKIQNWGFRAGIIESTGGIGVDYFWQSASTMFSLELFDYREELGPNLRLTTRFHIWNVFYGNLQFEDLVSKKDEQSITLGAGLKFTDEDLKGLLAFFL